jgi:RHS repeat-associated protein
MLSLGECQECAGLLNGKPFPTHDLSPPTGEIRRSYHYAGTQRVAMRIDQDGQISKLYYLLSDHLGSTSLTVAAATNTKVAELRYDPWGSVRYANGTQVTDYTYTGQRDFTSDFGLMYYNARWYDPYNTHFSSPDSIIPDHYNPLDYNRYTYARNNPLKYTDPTGHLSKDEIMSHFGVGSWDKVLTSFEEGGQFEAKWGWLRSLRKMNVGDKIYFIENYVPCQGIDNFGCDGIFDGSEVLATGYLTEDNNGNFMISLDNGNAISLHDAAFMGNAFSVSHVDRRFGFDHLYGNETFYAAGSYMVCKGCGYPVTGIAVDILGIIADIELMSTGDPVLTGAVTFIEAAYITSGAISGKEEKSQLYLDMLLADTLATTPITGIGYSFWGLWLNIQDIGQRMEIHGFD